MGDVSKNFSRSEFACKCGCGRDTMDAKTLEIAEFVREMVGVPVTVLSGHRCAVHNKKVGGAKTSQHLYGRAIDLAVTDPMVVAVAVRKRFSMASTGVYPTKGFLHVDTRSGEPKHWEG